MVSKAHQHLLHSGLGRKAVAARPSESSHAVQKVDGKVFVDTEVSFLNLGTGQRTSRQGFQYPGTAYPEEPNGCVSPESHPGGETAPAWTDLRSSGPCGPEGSPGGLLDGTVHDDGDSEAGLGEPG